MASLIEIIHKFCNDTETHPKDLVIQWNMQRHPIVFAQGRNGQVVYMQIFERIDRVVEAIQLCATRHEDKFDKFLAAQEAVFDKYRERAGETAEGLAPPQALKPGKRTAPSSGHARLAPDEPCRQEPRVHDASMMGDLLRHNAKTRMVLFPGTWTAFVQPSLIFSKP